MRKLGWILVAVVLTLASSVSAQVDTAWVRTRSGGFRPLGVRCDVDGNVYAVGVPRFSNQYAFVLVKYAPDGSLLWEINSLDVPINGEAPTDMEFDASGQVYLIGTFHGPDENRDLGVIKLSPDGQTEWVKYLDGRDHSREELGKIALGPEGTVYVAGRSRRVCTHVPCSYQNDLVFGAYTEAGSLLWQSQPALPDSLDASVADLVAYPGGGVVAAGAITEALQDHAVGLVERVEADGVPLWSCLRAGIGRNGAFARKMAVDPLGNAVVGYCRASRFQIVKFDPSGDSTWVCEPSLLTWGIKSLLDLALDSHGHTVVAGYVSMTGGFTSEQVVFKVSPSGSLLWSDTIDGPVRGNDQAYRLAINRDNEIYVAGAVDTDSATDLVTPKLTLFKYSAQGHRIWAMGQSNDFPLSCPATPGAIALDEDENIIVAAAQSMNDGDEALTIIKLVEDWLVVVDILPGSCPNIISTGGIDLDYHGIRPGAAAANRPMVPVAILGTKTFDVSRVEPSTIEIAGRSPLSHRIMEISRPVEAREGDCDCAVGGADGFDDLVLYFDQAQFVAALGPVNDGELRTLELTGKTKTGVPLSGSDCVTIKEGPIRVSPLASAGEKIESGFAAYPNPFNAATVVSFYLTSESDVRLEVYDVLGRRVATLVNNLMSTGEHQVSWDAAGWASGVYFARLSTSEGMMTRKLVLVR